MRQDTVKFMTLKVSVDKPNFTLTFVVKTVGTVAKSNSIHGQIHDIVPLNSFQLPGPLSSVWRCISSNKFSNLGFFFLFSLLPFFLLCSLLSILFLSYLFLLFKSVLLKYRTLQCPHSNCTAFWVLMNLQIYSCTRVSCVTTTIF